MAAKSDRASQSVLHRALALFPRLLRAHFTRPRSRRVLLRPTPSSVLSASDRLHPTETPFRRMAGELRGLDPVATRNVHQSARGGVSSTSRDRTRNHFHHRSCQNCNRHGNLQCFSRYFACRGVEVPDSFRLSASFVVFFSIFTVLVVGPRKLTQSPTLRTQFKDQLIIIASQGVVVVCYPIFSAIFNQLPGIQQTIFIFVMPLIKFCTKQNIANAAKSYHEYVGPVVVFSVDLFNVYYVAICMQASKSIVTTLIIMATDSFHVVLALRAIFHHGSSIRPHHGSTVDDYLQDVPALLRTLYNGEGSCTRQTRRIRLFAPFPLPLSQGSTKFMDEMSKTGRFASDKATNRRCSSKAAAKRNSGAPNRVFNTPMPTITSLKQLQTTPAIESTRGFGKTGGDSSYHEEVAQDALQTLFHSEYILLAEYVEFIVPMLYSLYLAVLFHIPVAAYYPHTASITEQKLKTTVMNIMIYGVIEFVSFGALLVLLRRKFGFSPLYQLAFVLETHAPALQGHLFVWTITILHLTLKHYGTLVCFVLGENAIKVSTSQLCGISSPGVDFNILAA